MRSLFAVPVLLLLVACGSDDPPGIDTGTGGACRATFNNPLGAGADPWVVRHDGRYYGVESREGGIWVYRSDTLTKFRTGGIRVWTPPSSGWNRQDVWAPELHRIGDRWYIYYAAGGPGAGFTDQRAGVLESATEDPQGAWIDRGMLYTGDDVATGANPVWAIDLTTSVIDGQRYAAWSGWAQNTTSDRTPQQLYIARMSNPWTISSNRVRISAPTASWEIGTELNLQEGPTFLQRGGRTFIVYSTRESWLPEYKLGLLSLAPSPADPLDPASWTKGAAPVFTGVPNEGVHGVGHASFTQSPDGTEDWIVYHAKSLSAPGWDDRVVRMQRFTWNTDGTPNFGRPAASGTALSVPSGQCAP